MTDAQAYFERRAREERARSFTCSNPIIAAARRRNADDFQRRANAETLAE